MVSPLGRCHIACKLFLNTSIFICIFFGRLFFLHAMIFVVFVSTLESYKSPMQWDFVLKILRKSFTELPIDNDLVHFTNMPVLLNLVLLYYYQSLTKVISHESSSRRFAMIRVSAAICCALLISPLWQVVTISFKYY